MFRSLKRMMQNHDSGNYRIKFGINCFTWYLYELKKIPHGHDPQTMIPVILLPCQMDRKTFIKLKDEPNPTRKSELLFIDFFEAEPELKA